MKIPAGVLRSTDFYAPTFKVNKDTKKRVALMSLETSEDGTSWRLMKPRGSGDHLVNREEVLGTDGVLAFDGGNLTSTDWAHIMS